MIRVPCSNRHCSGLQAFIRRPSLLCSQQQHLDPNSPFQRKNHSSSLARTARAPPGLDTATIRRRNLLNDAAIALHQVLAPANIRFGIFGGYALNALGSVRRTKDINCLASVSKEQAIALLDGKNGFSVALQHRQDYVKFMWPWPPRSDESGELDAIPVEIFCEVFPGAQYSMSTMHPEPTVRSVDGDRLGTGPSTFLDPFYLFKDKLHAAATRAKPEPRHTSEARSKSKSNSKPRSAFRPVSPDSFDLRWLADNYSPAIKPRSVELNPQFVGLALKQYTELGPYFHALGVNIAAAKQAVRELSPEYLTAPEDGDVQRGLLG
ncbi:uncharacterized protein BDV17DRAFT_196954 [Aspergillus undulatus]|uniref:uncharacterized protein n=1 Tax=Aspergillus undulatus TaxID=1810928 RepID=UPI003CCE3CC5